MNKGQYKAYSTTPGIVRVSCVFAPNDLNPPVVSDRIGVSGVTRLGTGLYRVELIEKHVSLVGFTTSVSQASIIITSFDTHLYDEDVSGSGYVYVRIMNDFPAPADPGILDPADISVTLFLKATTAV